MEGTVGKIATAIIAKLRNEVFYSFPDLKAAVSKKLYEFNHNDFQKREGSRYDAYLDEKEFLHIFLLGTGESSRKKEPEKPSLLLPESFSSSSTQC